MKNREDTARVRRERDELIAALERVQSQLFDYLHAAAQAARLEGEVPVAEARFAVVRLQHLAETLAQIITTEQEAAIPRAARFLLAHADEFHLPTLQRDTLLEKAVPQNVHLVLESCGRPCAAFLSRGGAAQKRDRAAGQALATLRFSGRVGRSPWPSTAYITSSRDDTLHGAHFDKAFALAAAPRGGYLNTLPLLDAL